MAHFDLEEQEQLDQLKHFWNRYGNLISAVLIVVFGGMAAWTGWQYWQRDQAAKAAVLYDVVESAAKAGELDKIERGLQDIRNRFGGTTFAAQAALAAAQAYAQAGKPEQAKGALQWVADEAKDDALKGIAHLRLAALAIDAKAWDEATRHLDAPMPKALAPLAADRRADWLLAQGKSDEARAEYEKAWAAMDRGSEYRRLVAVKLAALGVEVQDPATGAQP